MHREELREKIAEIIRVDEGSPVASARDILALILPELKDCQNCCYECTDQFIEAAKMAGRKEVVDALHDVYLAEPPVEGKSYIYLGCYITKWGKAIDPTIAFRRLSDDETWQAKKIEWGIE